MVRLYLKRWPAYSWKHLLHRALFVNSDLSNPVPILNKLVFFGKHQHWHLVLNLSASPYSRDTSTARTDQHRAHVSAELCDQTKLSEDGSLRRLNVFREELKVRDMQCKF